jgi:hypothetical protein
MEVNAPIGVQAGMAVGFHLDWTVLTGFPSRQQKFFPQPGADSRGTQLDDLYPPHLISSFKPSSGLTERELNKGRVILIPQQMDSGRRIDDRCIEVVGIGAGNGNPDSASLG